MDPNQAEGQVRRLLGQAAVQANERPAKDKGRKTVDRPENIGQDHHLLNVVLNLLHITVSYTLTHYCDNGQVDGIAGDTGQGVNGTGHRIGRGLHRAKEGDHADHHGTAQIKQAALAGGGNANTQNLFHHIRTQMEQVLSLQIEFLLSAAKEQDGQKGRYHTGDQGGDRHTGYTHF